MVGVERRVIVRRRRYRTRYAQQTHPFRITSCLHSQEEEEKSTCSFQYVSRTVYDEGDVRWRPAATPLRGHHGVPNERECRGGDARSPCRRLAHPSGPCPSNRARRQTARGRGRLRPCASKTVSASSTCEERALSVGAGDAETGRDGGWMGGRRRGGGREREDLSSLGHDRH